MPGLHGSIVTLIDFRSLSAAMRKRKQRNAEEASGGGQFIASGLKSSAPMQARGQRMGVVSRAPRSPRCDYAGTMTRSQCEAILPKSVSAVSSGKPCSQQVAAIRKSTGPAATPFARHTARSLAAAT